MIQKNDSGQVFTFQKNDSGFRIQDSGLFFTFQNDSAKMIQLCFYVPCPKNGVYILNPGRRRFPSYIRSLDDPTTPNVRPVNAGTGVAAEGALLPPVLPVHERCLLHIDTVVFSYGDCIGITSYLRD